jgi:hypothetical protein
MNRIGELLLGWPASVEEVFHQVLSPPGQTLAITGTLQLASAHVASCRRSFFSCRSCVTC